MNGGEVRKPRSGAVVVLYHPDAACVERANRLAATMRCVVVDNTPSLRGKSELGLSDSIEYLCNGENLGIATAINQGIEVLIREGFEVAILFDQDSEPPASLLTELPAIIARANSSQERVALVGPAYDDPRLRGVAPFVRFKWWTLERISPTGDEPIDVDFLISSGSCINLRWWANIGPMDDALFIDFVDLEWCVRAKQKGFRVLGVPWVRMSHELGGEPVRVLGRSYPMHGPLRHYYQFRNVVALMKRASMPMTWKSTELVKLPVRIVIYCFFPERRKEHLVMVWRGIRDGLRGRLGAYRGR
ncbi:glycosyltransferase family 2 protein [bacterium M00.F.Ca.ET.228.01.1.1]|uniref:glycosyltransferase family 2 protein n=1 Tax=Paraburkholderia phenoliruptrix TaxID=252970 RepID=UPI001091C141|nr:glycosyltransferase family 2 protein [Paraburkholderia phenoliruptrix]MBW9099440.1 glycosyltransferase family 2 protein [Paraburkholderia phenoliruptrix]TGP43124.1 glycosyltransferase family 2 protein [bacterium M00.F.Ca.ET.228.01.1.1]TGS00563.1 glycosyltransferase family 2 protein [bacterium M00.F.Ca.ET.191.01.1.1]TGU04949.1 glycosyltransferase family 2 protein [bacterium M00.F.Ca.ET.155.01.1.1]